MRNLERSCFFIKNLRESVVGDKTIAVGKEFQTFTMRQEKKLCLIECLAIGI